MSVRVDELRDRFCLNDGLMPKFALWADFEKKVLKVAQNEINEKADFQFDYTLRKEGRKVAAIDFKFRKSIQVQQPITVPIQATKQVQGQTDARLPRTIERLKSYGLNEHQINIVLKKYTVTELCKILYELDCNKETIKNTVAYLCKILEL